MGPVWGGESGPQLKSFRYKVFKNCAKDDTSAIESGICWCRVFSFPPALRGLPRRFSSKESTCSFRDQGLIPGLGTSHGEGNGNPLRYSSLDRGAWQATVCEVAEKVRHNLAKQQQPCPKKEPLLVSFLRLPPTPI